MMVSDFLRKLPKIACKIFKIIYISPIANPSWEGWNEVLTPVNECPGTPMVNTCTACTVLLCMYTHTLICHILKSTLKDIWHYIQFPKGLI